MIWYDMMYCDDDVMEYVLWMVMEYANANGNYNGMYWYDSNGNG